MEFVRFDLGQILRNYCGEKAPEIDRIVVGNPLITKQMIEHLPDAGCCAQVTILINERTDGCICLMTGWPVFSLPTKICKPSRSRKIWTPRVEAWLLIAAG